MPRGLGLSSNGWQYSSRGPSQFWISKIEGGKEALPFFEICRSCAALVGSGLKPRNGYTHTPGTLDSSRLAYNPSCMPRWGDTS